MTVVVTHTTPADSTFSSTGAAAWNADHALSGVGTMAEQNANNVAITGGTINNTTIGATTPSTGVFTTLTATGQTSLGGVAGSESLRILTPPSTGRYFIARGSSGNPDLGVSGGAMILYGGANQGIAFYSNGYSQAQFNVPHTASAVNFAQATGAATGSGPVFSVAGSDTNIDLNLTTKGTGVVNLNTGGGTQVQVSNTASAVNYVELTGGPLNNAPTIGAKGSNTNISFAYSSKGTGGHDFYTAGTSFTKQMVVAHTASAVNYVEVTGGSTGNSPSISWQGSDANIQAAYLSKGSGVHSFFSGLGARKLLQLSDAASSVNFLEIIPSATGVGVRLIANGSDTNIPLVLQPKGTGALQAQQTDSTATGGNARGANAVDWQTSRTSANQVASAGQAVVGGGSQNIASGQYAVAAGGVSNGSGSFASVVSGGWNNFAVANNASIVGGYNNSASGIYSFIGSGQSNTASGYYGIVGGGFTNSTTSNSAVTTQSATMNGTTAVTLSGSNASIKVGQYITGTSISGDTYVAAISGTSLTLSKVASGSSTSTLSFYTPHGVVVGGGNNQATGAYSFIGGGGDAGTAANRNVASGDWSVVTGGFKNTATAPGSFVGGGGTYGDGSSGGNSAISQGSSVVGGFNNVASGFISFVGGGNSNTANGQYSFIGGGAVGTTRSIQGNHVFPAHNAPVSFSSGASQAGLLILGRVTTDATATRLTSDPTTTGGTTNQVILPNNSAYFFTGEVVSGVTGGGNTKGWTIEGVIKRGANAASTALVGTPTVTSTYADAGAATWTIALSADTTNGGLAVTFTGQASTTIRTVCQIRTTEMTY
jgi:hypothetical protein